MNRIALAALTLLAGCAPTVHDKMVDAELRSTLNQWAVICENSQEVADADAISQAAGNAKFRECIDWHMAQWHEQRALTAAAGADPGLYIDRGVRVAPVRPYFEPQPAQVIVVTP